MTWPIDEQQRTAHSSSDKVVFQHQSEGMKLQFEISQP